MGQMNTFLYHAAETNTPQQATGHGLISLITADKQLPF